MEYKEYWHEVETLADTVVEQAMQDSDNDIVDAMDRASDLLHEVVDGHPWIIYNSYNLDVIRWSPNEDYATDHFGTEWLETELKKGLDGLHNAVAFWAFYADISEKVYGDFSLFGELEGRGLKFEQTNRREC